MQVTSRSICFPYARSATSKSCSAWSPTQNAEEVPKNLARRNAVSAVIALRNFVISVNREAGMPVARATDAKLNPIGRMNSSSRISPGWTVGRYLEVLMVLMVIDDPDVVLQTFFPSENDPPLLVDSNAPKPLQVAAQLLKPVAGRNPEILHDSRLVDHPQLASRPYLDLSRQFANTQTSVNGLSI